MPHPAYHRNSSFDFSYKMIKVNVNNRRRRYFPAYWQKLTKLVAHSCPDNWKRTLQHMNADEEERQQDNNGQMLSYLSLSCVVWKGECTIYDCWGLKAVPARPILCKILKSGAAMAMRWCDCASASARARNAHNAHCVIQRALEGPEGLVEQSLVGSVGRTAIS